MIAVLIHLLGIAADWYTTKRAVVDGDLREGMTAPAWVLKRWGEIGLALLLLAPFALGVYFWYTTDDTRYSDAANLIAGALHLLAASHNWKILRRRRG